MKGHRGTNASVKSEGTRPERRVRRALLQMGLHYRINFRGVPGTPDIAFPRAKKAVFVHGCFWHLHPECAARHLRGVHGKNSAYWHEKLARNVLRDRKNLRELDTIGWSVLIVWECETCKASELRTRLRNFLKHGVGAVR
jgi:DNA mismatch endonuclease (patch repair protein)